jgi:hypothetical protein
MCKRAKRLPCIRCERKAQEGLKTLQKTCWVDVIHFNGLDSVLLSPSEADNMESGLAQGMPDGIVDYRIVRGYQVGQWTKPESDWTWISLMKFYRPERIPARNGRYEERYLVPYNPYQGVPRLLVDLESSPFPVPEYLYQTDGKLSLN